MVIKEEGPEKEKEKGQEVAVRLEESNPRDGPDECCSVKDDMLNREPDEKGRRRYDPGSVQSRASRR